MTNDARLSVELPNHPKTKKLIRRLGAEGAWYLVRLILWTASNRSDGDLSGITHEDIELAVDWPGQPNVLVTALLEVGFLDGTQDGLKFHGWSEHNPWAFGQNLRSAKARWNAVKRYHGELEADRQVPEYVATRGAASGDDRNPSTAASSASSTATSTATSTRVAMRLVKGSNALLPLPHPLPHPLSAAEEAAAKKYEDKRYLIIRDFDVGEITSQERDNKIAALEKEIDELRTKAVSA